jgi:Protein of unknown function (DUF2795)
MDADGLGPPPPQAGEDPARPEFGAEQSTLRHSPRDALHGHPVEALLRRLSYPASRADIVEAARRDPSTDPEVQSWLAAVLPDATFAGFDDVADRIRRSGLGPPAAPGSAASGATED